MNRYDKLFLTILVAGFLVRLYNFDYPISDQEVHIQYLQARHIVFFGERPLVGYPNGTFQSLGSSPLYLYLLAGLIFIKDNLLFPGFINLFLQTATIPMLYYLAKKMFGDKMALISAIFLSFGFIQINYSLKMWIPHLAYFFVTLSYFLLFLSFQKKKLAFLLASSVFFAAAAALHLSVFTLAPLYLIICFFVTRKFFVVLTTFLASLFVFFAPLLGNLASTSLPFVTSLGEFFISLFDKTKTFLNLFFPLDNPYGVMALTVFTLLTLNYFLKAKEKKNIFSKILFASVLVMIFAAAFVKKPFLPQHFTPVIGLFPLFASEMINYPIGKHYSAKLAHIAIVILFVFSFSHGLIYLKAKPILGNLATANYLNEKVENAAQGQPSYKFELITSPEVQKQPDDIWFFDSLFWINLERKLNTKLVKVYYPTSYDVNPEHYYQVLGNNNYLFLGCQSFSFPLTDCLQKYLISQKNFRLREKLIEDFKGYSFYLLERKSP